VNGDFARQVGVHLGDGSRSTFRFQFLNKVQNKNKSINLSEQVPIYFSHVTYANIARSEQELTVKVTLFNGIHISDNQTTIRTSTQTHHCPVLEHFTTNGTSTNKELLGVFNLFLEGTAKDSNLTIIT
jgi:hypothetical protein